MKILVLESSGLVAFLGGVGEEKDYMRGSCDRREADQGIYHKL